MATFNRPAPSVPAPIPAPAITAPPNLVPVPRWNDYFDWPPLGGMRHLIFHADTNGFEDAFIRVGRSVLVDVPVFFARVERGRGAQPRQRKRRKTAVVET